MLAKDRVDQHTVDWLWERVAAGSADALRGAAFAVFNQQSRWERLVLACRALGADVPDLVERGETMLRSTLAGWNSSATDPTPEQVTELRALVEPTRFRLPGRTYEQLAALLSTVS